jgi:hypothetical protein
MRSDIIISAVVAFAAAGAQDIDFVGVNNTPDSVINIIPALVEQLIPFDMDQVVAAVASRSQPIRSKLSRCLRQQLYPETSSAI